VFVEKYMGAIRQQKLTSPLEKRKVGKIGVGGGILAVEHGFPLP
jgi:hypothetical protein